MVKKVRKIKDKILKIFKSRKRFKNLKAGSKHITLEDIVKDLKLIGIRNNDVLLVHSSLKSIGFVENGAKTVINALLKVIGQQGTLGIPTYSMKGTMYNTCISKNYTFDLKKSPAVLGAIPSEFLKLKGIYRSIHPTHSISAIGKYAKEITENHHIGIRTFGENSPWSKISELKGKILGIGISLGPTTQYHHIEDIMNEDFPVKVKLDEIYELKCKIGKRKYIKVKVQPHDPEVAKLRIDQKKNQFIRDYFWELFEKAKILHIGNIGESRSWWMYAKDCYDLLTKLAKLDITIYSTKNELISKNLFPFDLIREKIRIS